MKGRIRVGVVVVSILTLAACQDVAPTASLTEGGCVEAPGPIRDLDWSPTGEWLAILVGYDDGTYGVRRSDGGLGRSEEIARGDEIDSAGMTIGPSAVVYWQVVRDGASLLRMWDGGDVHEWSGPASGFSNIEAASGRLLATQIQAVGEDANLVDVVEVILGSDASVSTRTIRSAVGVQALASNPKGTAIGLGSQAAAGRPLAVEVFGAEDWRFEVATGWPNQIALAPEGGAVAVRDVSASTLAWVGESGVETETIIGDTPVVTFDVSSSGRLAYSSTDGTSWSLCTSARDPVGASRIVETTAR